MTGLTQWIERLATLQVAETQRQVLERAAEQLLAGVMENLSAVPGEDHAMPWRRSGALQDSIASSVDDDTAVVGSDSEVAAAQEQGTGTLPPRPFLGPAAVQLAEPIADAIGAAFAALLEGRQPE